MEDEILLIEDEAQWQREIKKILEDGGYGVRVAGNFAEAVQALKDCTAKVAVVDVSLIEYDSEDRQGYKVMKHVMEQAPIPIVCISGYLTAGEVGEVFHKRLAGWFFAKSDLAQRKDKRKEFLEAVELAKVQSKAKTKKTWSRIHQQLRDGD